MTCLVGLMLRVNFSTCPVVVQLISSCNALTLHPVGQQHAKGSMDYSVTVSVLLFAVSFELKSDCFLNVVYFDFFWGPLKHFDYTNITC